MNHIPPIYGTTISGTETILDMWLRGDREEAARFLVMCISVNAPYTPCNTERMAVDTIEKYIEDNF